MTENCNIVRDLLPLYTDGACSGESRTFVEAHLRECSACAALLNELRRSDVETELASEKNGVLTRHETRQRRRALTAGAVIGGILMIPVLVCLIVNLASGHALNWFFIVLCSLCVFASLTVVPLLLPRYKFAGTAAAFTLSLLLLLGVCALYSGGNWFPVTAAAVLFGLSVVLLPFLVSVQPLRDALNGWRGLTVFAADTLLLFVLLLLCGLRSDDPDYGRIAAASALLPLVWVWGLFLSIRYAPLPGAGRTGLCLILTGLASFFADSVVGALLGSAVPLPRLTLSPDTIAELSDDILCLILALCALAGTILIVLSLVRRGRQKKKGDLL